jgi:large subunit ribosomal protein L18
VTEAVLDLGLHARGPGSRIFAATKGAVDAGLTVPHDDSALPSKERIQGEHIENYSKKLAPDQDRYKKVFSTYVRVKQKPEEIANHFKEVEAKIRTLQGEHNA